tara:strand:- start:238 stop:498 length:261 start_codon:yes stop_codon:yes gene_type:complete
MAPAFLLLTLLSVQSIDASEEKVGYGMAAMACSMLETGQSKARVEYEIEQLEAKLLRSDYNRKQLVEITQGYNYWINYYRCTLQIR